MSLPAELERDLNAFDSTLENLEARLTPFFQVPLADLEAKLDNVELAKLQMTLAYTINSLFFGTTHFISVYCSAVALHSASPFQR